MNTIERKDVWNEKKDTCKYFNKDLHMCEHIHVNIANCPTCKYYWNKYSTEPIPIEIQNIPTSEIVKLAGNMIEGAGEKNLSESKKMPENNKKNDIYFSFDGRNNTIKIMFTGMKCPKNKCDKIISLVISDESFYYECSFHGKLLERNHKQILNKYAKQ